MRSLSRSGGHAVALRPRSVASHTPQDEGAGIQPFPARKGAVRLSWAGQAPRQAPHRRQETPCTASRDRTGLARSGRSQRFISCVSVWRECWSLGAPRPGPFSLSQRQRARRDSAAARPALTLTRRGKGGGRGRGRPYQRHDLTTTAKKNRAWSVLVSNDP